MIRVRFAALFAVAALCLVGVKAAAADTKAEMVAIIDKIAQSKPDAESVIDWDNLAVKSPQVKNMDVHKMYSGMDEANKKAFRASFLKSFAASFQQQAHGHTFAEAAKIKGAMEVKDKGEHPSLVLHGNEGKGGLKLGYVRKKGKLQLQSIEAGA